jgi:RNA polymerase sigma factor (sigma-70 family)
MPPADASAFPPTRHSLVARLGDAADGERRAAFDDLVRAYRPAILGYLIRRWHLAAADADDATQSLLLQLWEQGTLAGFDPAKARFRTFLRTCIDRHASNRLRAARALRRGGGAEHLPLDDVAAANALEAHAAQVAAADADDAESCFRDEVARALLARAIARLRQELEQRDRLVVFEVLRRYDLEPVPDLRYAQVAEALGLSVTQVTNHLHGARRRLRALALDEVRAMCADDEEYRDEARALLGVRIA